MGEMRILIANEPRTYREALVDALRMFRPQVEVSTVEPHGLAAEIGRLHPHLVVCSQLWVAAQDGALTWVVLYPDGENRAEVFTAGEHATIASIGFGDLLSIIDRAELLCRVS
jgi:hypothetical protein